ncbi:MAG: helix-turn-helix transcriptional regulator [Ktedonobacteraceae bacterium]
MHTKEFDLGRFSDPSLLILASLASGPKHGYAMMEDIAEFCGTRLEPGTLYAALTRLERRGWIEALLSEQSLRLYRITPPGLLAIERAETHHQGEKLQEGGYLPWHKGGEIIMRLVLWMLRLYPPAWCERYEAEMVALLEQHVITPLDDGGSACGSTGCPTGPPLSSWAATPSNAAASGLIEMVRPRLCRLLVQFLHLVCDVGPAHRSCRSLF